MKIHVARIVAAPKHKQHTQKYLVDNHNQVEPTQTQSAHWKTLLFRVPPFGPLCYYSLPSSYHLHAPNINFTGTWNVDNFGTSFKTACHLKFLTGGVATLTNPAR